MAREIMKKMITRTAPVILTRRSYSDDCREQDRRERRDGESGGKPY